MGRLLTPQPVPGGYLRVQLWRGGKVKNALLHVLVARAFLEPPPGRGYEVNHDDGNKHNCAASNLEWMTRPENMRHAYRTGLRRSLAGRKRPDLAKPRITVACACGCGTRIITPGPRGADRQFVSGHNRRGQKQTNETRAKISAAKSRRRQSASA